MKNIYKYTATILYSFLFVFAAGNMHAQLVTNGSFEETNPGPVSGTDVNGWVIEVSSGLAPLINTAILDDTVQQGSRALRVRVDTVGANEWDIQVVADSIPVIPGETYRYTIWAKSRVSGAQTNFTVGNYAYHEYGVIRPATLTTTWQQFTFQFTIDDEETYARAPIHFSISQNKGNTIYIDNLRIVNLNDLKKPIIVEAESGVLGNDFSVLGSGDTSCISIQTDMINSDNPGNTNRIATYSVTFPDTGSYNLFARIRVGDDTTSDDSYFYGNGFGIKDTINNNDWITVDGLQISGFADTGNIVFDPGGLNNGIWKWINLSTNSYLGEQGIVFQVLNDSLTRTFQIGGRENGLDIDKFAFGRSYLYFTVKCLDSVLAGSPNRTVWTGPPLASGQEKFVGCVYSSYQSPNFAAYWNQVTPENAGKWGVAEPSLDAMNWATLDATNNFAQTNNFLYKHHALVWGNQYPTWIDALDSASQRAQVEEWIHLVGDRYPNMDFVDVVNEPLHAPPTFKNSIGGNGATGWDWVVTSFQWARQYCDPSVKLILNDYNILQDGGVTNTYMNLIDTLKVRGLIDAIGIQGHYFEFKGSGYTYPIATLEYNLNRLATLGLPIYITEFDINEADDNIQLQDYQTYFRLFYENPGVKGITLWGWKPGTWQVNAFLVDQNGAERPALQWLREYLDTVTTVSVKNTEYLPGTYELSQNYPNPFNPTTIINYRVPVTSYISIKVFDILGREITTLFEGIKQAGNHQVTFDGSKYAGGIYFYRLQAPDFMVTKKLVLLK